MDNRLRTSLNELLGGRAPWPLFLCGAAGTGKTRAALCVLDHAIGHTAYWCINDLCERLIQVRRGSSYWPGETGGKVFESDIWSDWTSADIAVLDELADRERASDFHYATAKKAIDFRETLPLIIISNGDLRAIERAYDDRMASRIGSGTTFDLGTADRRIGNVAG